MFQIHFSKPVFKAGDKPNSTLKIAFGPYEQIEVESDGNIRARYMDYTEEDRFPYIHVGYRLPDGLTYTSMKVRQYENDAIFYLPSYQYILDEDDTSYLAENVVVLDMGDFVDLITKGEEPFVIDLSDEMYDTPIDLRAAWERYPWRSAGIPSYNALSLLVGSKLSAEDGLYKPFDLAYLFISLMKGEEV